MRKPRNKKKKQKQAEIDFVFYKWIQTRGIE